jgi:ABC-2 type transport system permease protein
MNFLIMPLFFLSGALFPIGRAPDWMRMVAHVNPLMYGVDGLRGAFSGAPDFPMWMDFGILFIFSAAMILLGGYLFRKTSA